MKQEYIQSSSEILQEMGVTEAGLSSAEAKKRREQYGPNKLKDAEKKSMLRRFLDQLKDPMLIILMVAAAVSAVTNIIAGESLAEVFIILIVVLLNAILGVVQESKAEAAIEALQTMTAATCKVIRDSKQIFIGIATFLIIGIFHPLVIKGEYYFGVKCWWVFALMGIISTAASILVKELTWSILLAVWGASSFWSIHELFEQRERVRKGWFPKRKVEN